MGNVKKELVSGVIYTAIAKYSNIAVQIIVTAILARLLTPEDYGVVAIATVFIVFFNLLSDIGIGPAIIQFKDLSKHDLNHIFSFTCYLGLMMSVSFFCCSRFVADYYNNDVLVPVCQFLSLAIFFFCLNIVPQNLQYREKRFKYVSLVSLFSYVLTAVIAVVMAIMGMGVYALVAQQIIAIALSFSIIYWRERLKFYFILDTTPLKRIMSFSIYQFLFNIINYFSRNLDKLLIGRYVGFAPLGQYEKSYRLMMMPLQNISFAVTPVLQPIFSEMQDDLQTMAEKYKKIFTFLSYIGFPLSVVLFFCGKELILLFFGPQWEDAIFPFRVLALTVGLQILNGTTGSIYQSANATKQLFISGCWCALFMTTSFIVAIFGWGTINAVAIGFFIAQLLNSIQVYYLLFKTLHYPLSHILPVMIKPLIISVVLGIILFCICLLCDNMIMLLSLFIKCFVSFVVWSLLMYYFSPYDKMMVNFLKKVFPNRN